MNLDVLRERADLLQKLFCRNSRQTPRLAIPGRPLPADYVPTFLLFDDFCHTCRGAETSLEKRDAENHGGEKTLGRMASLQSKLGGGPLGIQLNESSIGILDYCSNAPL